MMTDQDWARYYEEHADDPDLWGAPEAAPSVGTRARSPSASITILLSPAEADRLRHVARRTGESYTEVVCRALGALLDAEGA